MAGQHQKATLATTVCGAYVSLYNIIDVIELDLPRSMTGVQALEILEATGGDGT